MNLGYDNEIIEELIPGIYWYPLEEIILAGTSSENSFATSGVIETEPYTF